MYLQMKNLIQEVRSYEFMQECRAILSYVDDYMKGTPKEQEEILHILYSSTEESEALMNLYHEIEQNFYINVLNYEIYFHRIYNEGIIDMMCQFQHMITLIQNGADTVNLQKFPIIRYHNKKEQLNLLDFLNNFCHFNLSLGAYKIRKYALSVGYKDIKESDVLMKEKMVNQDFGGLFFRLIGKSNRLLSEDNSIFDNDIEHKTSKNETTNIPKPSHRIVIFAHNYRADSGSIPKINSKKAWKEHGDNEGVSGKNRANAFYTTNSKSERYDPPRADEIPAILEILSDDPQALKSAKEGILKELSAMKNINGVLVDYKDRYLIAKQYIDNYHT